MVGHVGADVEPGDLLYLAMEFFGDQPGAGGKIQHQRVLAGLGQLKYLLINCWSSTQLDEWLYF